MTNINRRRFPILLASALAVLAILGALFLPDRAQAQTIVLVSNIGQTSSSFLDLNPVGIDNALQFTTGGNTGGYNLDSVELKVKDYENVVLTVSLYSDSSGVPGSSIFTFDNPDPITANANNTFTAPANTTLMASTPYHIVVSGTNDPDQSSNKVRLFISSSNVEDEGGATDSEGTPDWAIADDGYFYSQGAWHDSSSSIQIRVNGSAASGDPPPLSTDATLSALSLGTGVTLSPAFASGKDTYTASVANSVDEVTVTPTTNHASATVEILDTDNLALTDADSTEDGFQVALSVGLTQLGVLVTAEDGTTTKLYTVNVTRDDFPNDTTTTGQVEVGGSVTGTGGTLDRDWFKVVLEAGTRYQIDLEGADTGRGTVENPAASMFDAGGTYLPQQDDSDSGVGNNARIIYTPTATGTYHVQTWNISAVKEGTYTLSVIVLGANGASEADTDFPTTTATTGRVDVGASVTGTIGNLDYDWFKVTLEAGKTYQIDLEGAPTGRGTLADTLLDNIRDSSGTEIIPTSNDDLDGNSLNSQTTFTPTATGTYYLVVTSAVANETGTYTLSVRDITPATCTLNAGDVWCGVVTVGMFTLGGTNYLGYYEPTGSGMLSDNDFDFTDTELDSESHTITGVLLASGTLSLIFEDSQDEDDKPVLNTWDLQVGTGTFALDDDDVTQLPTGGYQWTGTGLSWSVGDTVTLRLRGETGPPSVANVAVTSEPLLTSSGGSEQDTYGAGDEIEFTVTFSQVVVVTGDPQFGFSLSGARQADYRSGSGSTALKFVYTVQSSDSDDDGIWIGNDNSTTKSLQLDANDEITSPGGIDANLEHDQLQVQAGHKVDGSRSSKPTLSIADAAAAEGDDLSFTVTLSAAAAADVTATWTASSETGDTAVAADLGTTRTGTVTVSMGNTTGTFTVSTVEDSTVEVNETFTVTLSSPSSNAALETDPTATGTIEDDDATLPTLSIADAAAAEGDDLSFTVTLSAAAAADVTATWTASIETGDTAVAADLGTTKTGTVEITVGDTDATITVATVEDTTVEVNETFTVTLSGPSSNAKLETDPTAKGTIEDDDATLPTLSIADAAASEGDDLSFTVTLSAAAAATVTATWTASIETGDTAVAADLGSTKTGTVTVAIGDTDATVPVSTVEDSTVEVNETFTVTLSSPSSNAQLSSTAATAQGTINNDDLATVSVADVSAAEGTTAGDGLAFTVTLSKAAPNDVTVDWTASIESGDSAAAADLTGDKSGTVTIAKGSTTGMFTVATADTTDENNQTFTVTLSNPTPTSLVELAADPTARGTIRDDDDPPTLTVVDMTVNEGDLNPDNVPTQSDTPGFPFRIELSEVSEKLVRFKLRQVVDGTATDADLKAATVFLGKGGPAEGDTSVTFGVSNIVNDALDEDDETFTIEIHSFENATAGAKTRSTITIEDDDPTPTVTVADGAATEGDKVEFVVTLSAVSGRDVDVDYATSVATGDGAVSGTDFTAASGTLTIAAADNTATGTIEVQTTEDDASESAETFTLTISSPDNATLTTDTTATGTINNRATTAAEPTTFAAAVGDAQVVLSWDAPDSASGVTRHEYQYKEGTGASKGWEQIANSGVDGANEAGFTVTGLTNEVLHTFQLRAVNAQGESTAAEADPVTPTPGICGRTQKVHEIIVYYLGEGGVERTCAEVNVADLESFTLSLEMAGENIASLKSGDFAGLSNLLTLELSRNTFTTLPANVFSGLTSLTNLQLPTGALSSIDAQAFSGLTALKILNLSDNDLDSLPGTVFSGLTALGTLELSKNDLSSLPVGLFSGLTALEQLHLNDNDLTSLDAGLFSGLAALEELELQDNDLGSLPGTVFSGLTALESLSLNDNDLNSLDAGVFSGLSNLQTLGLRNNNLSSLPDGLFSGLRGLTALRLNGNAVDPLPLTVTVEKFGTDRARAKVLAGAPAPLSFNVTVVNGSLPTGVTKLAVAAGSVDGTAERVTRTSGTMAAVTVDIDLSTQPTLPTDHSGYEFVKATTGLPATILPDTRGPQNFAAAPGDGQAVLSWTAPASGSGVTKHQYRQKEGSGSYPATWTDIPNSAEGGANEDGYTVTGLTNETVYTFELKRFVGTTESATAESNAVTPTPGICDRTQEVQDGILAKLADVSECEAVTVANLAGIGGLSIENKGITSLKAGDFAGLTAVETLDAFGNPSLTTLPSGVFAGLTAVLDINLKENGLETLPADVFSGLPTLAIVNLRDNELATLPAGLFSGLAALEQLYLSGNDLTALPAGLFSGLTGLFSLELQGNPVDPLPLTVTLEKVGTDQVRAKVLAGAPFAVAIPVTPENGTLARWRAASRRSTWRRVRWRARRSR